MQPRKLLFILPFITILVAAGVRTISSQVQGWYEETIRREPYEYMFEGRRSIEIQGVEFRTFQAGFKGIFLYGGLKFIIESMMREQGHTQYQGDFYNLEVFQAIAPMPAFLDDNAMLESWTNEKFLHYNPEFVAWGFKNMIPDPNEEIDGVSYQEVYDVIGYRFVQMLAATHYALEEEGLRSEVKEYRNAMKVEDFDAYEFMGQRPFLSNSIDTHFASEYYSSFDAGEAYCWWIRRVLDGSEEALWEGIQDVLSAYDPDFDASLMN